MGYSPWGHKESDTEVRCRGFRFTRKKSQMDQITTVCKSSSQRSELWEQVTPDNPFAIL